LPAGLILLFDLLWIIQDKNDHEIDLNLAHHIVSVHQTGCEAVIENNQHFIHMKTLRYNLVFVLFIYIYMYLFIRRYVATCKKKQPLVPESFIDYVVTAYVELRKQAHVREDVTYTSTFINCTCLSSLW